jgi:hypothetical protein
MAGLIGEIPALIGEELNPGELIRGKTADMANDAIGNFLHNIPIIGQMMDGATWLGKEIKGVAIDAEHGALDLVGDAVGKNNEVWLKDFLNITDEPLSSGSINKALKAAGYDVEGMSEQNKEIALKLVNGEKVLPSEIREMNGSQLDPLQNKFNRLNKNVPNSERINHLHDYLNKNPELREKFDSLLKNDKIVFDKNGILTGRTGKISTLESATLDEINGVLDKSVLSDMTNPRPRWGRAGLGRFTKIGLPPPIEELPATLSEIPEVAPELEKVAEAASVDTGEISLPPELEEEIPRQQMQKIVAIKEAEIDEIAKSITAKSGNEILNNAVLDVKDISKDLIEQYGVSVAGVDIEEIAANYLNRINAINELGDLTPSTVDSAISSFIAEVKNLNIEQLKMDSILFQNIEKGDVNKIVKYFEENQSELMDGALESSEEMDTFKDTIKDFFKSGKNKLSDLYDTLTGKYGKLSDSTRKVIEGGAKLIGGFGVGAGLTWVIEEVSKSDMSENMKDFVTKNLKIAQSGSQQLTNKGFDQIFNTISELSSDMAMQDKLINKRNSTLTTINNNTSKNPTSDRNKLKATEKKILENEAKIKGNVDKIKKDIEASRRQQNMASKKIAQKKVNAKLNKEIKEQVSKQQTEASGNKPININMVQSAPDIKNKSLLTSFQPINTNSKNMKTPEKESRPMFKKSSVMQEQKKPIETPPEKIDDNFLKKSTQPRSLLNIKTNRK